MPVPTKAINAVMTALLALAVVFTFQVNALAQQKNIGWLKPCNT